MKLHDYSGLDEQVKEHKKFKLKLNHLRKKLEKGAENLDQEAYKLLRDWFSGHILEVDQQYAPFFKEKGVD